MSPAPHIAVQVFLGTLTNATLSLAFAPSA